MKIMKKTVLIFLLILLLSGCGSASSLARLRAEAEPAATELEFSVFYHGFVIKSADSDTPVVPDGTFVIESREEYDAFFAAYDLASIYQLDTVDFDKECLVYDSNTSAQGGAWMVREDRRGSSGGWPGESGI